MYEQFLQGIVHSFVRHLQSWYQGNGLGQRRYGLPFRQYRLLPAALWEASTPPLQSEHREVLFRQSSIRPAVSVSSCTYSPPGRLRLPYPHRPINQSTLTLTSLRLASSVLGSLTSKTPSLNAALTLSA